MRAAGPLRDDDGSSVVEVLVTATLTILVLTMAATDALPAMRALEDVVRSDARHLELDVAGDVVARAVRAARPGIVGAGVVGDEDHLEVAVGPRTTLRLTLDEGSLVVDVEGDVGGAEGFATGVIVAGLDPERSRFELHDGRSVGTGGDATTMVVLRLSDGEHDVVRIVAPRLQAPLDGATSW